jgi:precorrin-4 methylase
MAPSVDRPVVFNDLSLIDQQTLQGYLRELQQELTSEQLQRVTTLMLTDPVKFHQYF